MYKEGLLQAFRDPHMTFSLVTLTTAGNNETDHALSETEVFTLTVEWEAHY